MTKKGFSEEFYGVNFFLNCVNELIGYVIAHHVTIVKLPMQHEQTTSNYFAVENSLL